MDKNTDQTNFWLAWHATCAAASCVDKDVLMRACQADRTKYSEVIEHLPETVKLSKEMIRMTNGIFKKALAYYDNVYKGHNSDYVDEVAGWTDENFASGCAFTILESAFYAKESIKGRPFKDYLFEDEAGRPGGMCKNLAGYIKRTLRSLARISFSKFSRLAVPKNDEGEELEEQIAVSESWQDDYSLSPELKLDIHAVEERFAQYIDALGFPQDGEPAVWDGDHWISIYCFLNYLPINTPEVAKLCQRGHSALSVVYRKTVNNLLLDLRKGLKASDRAIGCAMNSGMLEILDKRMKNMPVYAALEAVRKARIG